MKLELELQKETRLDGIPSQESFDTWFKAAIRDERGQTEMVIRLVDEDEIRRLNREYRNKDRSTNVLSFPSNVPEVVDSSLLGDLVICAPIVVHEAREQGKPEDAHWAHMVVHGVLHLLGYDHHDDGAAESMEQLETKIMVGLGFQDPYKEGTDE